MWLVGVAAAGYDWKTCGDVRDVDSDREVADEKDTRAKMVKTQKVEGYKQNHVDAMMLLTQSIAAEDENNNCKNSWF